MALRSTRLAPIHAARLRPLASHQQLTDEAAASCTADWPEPGTWEEKAISEGRWIDGDPAYWAREFFRTDGSTFDRLVEDNEEAAALERQSWYELDTAKRLLRSARLKRTAAGYRSEASEIRVDERMDSAVATKAINVVQALAAVSRAWPRLTPKGRALAQQATLAAALALRHAGIEPTGPAYGEAI